MEEVPRLNGVIRALENGGTAFTTFAGADIPTATSLADSNYDGLVFEMEHGPYDIRALRDAFQYLLSRRQIVQRGTLAPAVTPRPDSTERRRAEPVDRKAGIGLWRVWDCVAPRQHGR